MSRHRHWRPGREEEGIAAGVAVDGECRFPAVYGEGDSCPAEVPGRIPGAGLHVYKLDLVERFGFEHEREARIRFVVVEALESVALGGHERGLGMVAEEGVLLPPEVCEVHG